MNISDILKDYKNSRPCGYDGMSINAENWNEAHNYHREMLDFHQRYYHPPGIIAGLEVIATDSQSSEIVICPGIATDCSGREIVVKKKIKIDLKDSKDDIVYIYLSQKKHERTEKDSKIYTEDNPHIEPFSYFEKDKIELARIQITNPIKISDAQDPLLPGKNEIDMTNRWSAGCSFMPITIAYCCDLLKTSEDKTKCKRGINHLVRYINHSSQHRAINLGSINLVNNGAALPTNDICLIYIPLDKNTYNARNTQTVYNSLNNQKALCVFDFAAENLTEGNNTNNLMTFFNQNFGHGIRHEILYLSSFVLERYSAYYEQNKHILYYWSKTMDFSKWLENDINRLNFGYNIAIYSLQRNLLSNI
ncbi:MAG: hypothetical protein HQK65_14525 [Desulfamplus sp.]|nr:hypothetical protein [Desulfamplus sp.]